jgi:hypothetical protein
LEKRVPAPRVVAALPVAPRTRSGKNTRNRRKTKNQKREKRKD